MPVKPKATSKSKPRAMPKSKLKATPTSKPRVTPTNKPRVTPTSTPKTIDDYIAAAPPQARERLREMLACLRKAAPKAEEALKWNNPALSYGTILSIFAAFTKHVSLYPTPSVIKAFAKDLTGFKTSSSTIQFPLDKPLPSALIRRIADYRVTQVREHGATWM